MINNLIIYSLTSSQRRQCKHFFVALLKGENSKPGLHGRHCVSSAFEHKRNIPVPGSHLRQQRGIPRTGDTNSFNGSSQVS